MGLPRNHWSPSRCGTDRRHDRTRSRLRTRWCRIGRILVGRDKPRPPAHSIGRPVQTVVVEVEMKTDHDRVESDRAGQPVTVWLLSAPRYPGTSGLESLDHPIPGTGQYRGTRIHQTSGRAGRGHDAGPAPGSIDTDCLQRCSMLGDGGGRIVRDEHDPTTSGLQASNCGNGTANGLMGEPDHTVEITQDGSYRRRVRPLVTTHGSSMPDPVDERADAMLATNPGGCQPVAVPRFEPFTALRFDPDRAGSPLTDLIAPPYDVLSATDLDVLGRRSPHNITHVDVPRDVDGPDRYEQAAARYREWVESGVLVRDSDESFTIYRMTFADATGRERSIIGVLGGLEVVAEGAGGVLPHERVTPKATTDRLDLTRATTANLSPVWGLSLASGLTEALLEPGELMGAVTVDGVEHRVERLSDPARVAVIRRIIESDDVLIADGHHRYGISRTYLAEHPALPAAGATLTFVNELIEEQLSVEAIHRIYPGLDAADLRRLLEQRFSITAGADPGPEVLAAMTARGCLCLLEPDGQRSWLEPRPGVFDDIRSLDGAWLEATLPGVEVEYQHGYEEVLERVAGGDCGILIRPVSVAEIERTAREGLLMPPKSTFFTPKLQTGFVIRPMDALGT